MTRGRAAALVFAAAALVFGASPVRQLSDSHYSLLLAQQLATRGSFDLAEHFRGELPAERFPGQRFDGLPYHLRRLGERVLYFYPPGAPLLAVPWMAAANGLGLGVLDTEGAYDRQREKRHQRLLAALFSAAFVAALFAAADQLLARRVALALTALVALGTPVWSTASRGYWSHTAALALAGAMLPLLVARERGAGAGGFRLGLLAAGAYVCRPTLALVVALVGCDLLARDRRAAGRFALGAALVLGGLVAHAAAVWGTALPPYFSASGFDWPRLERLAGVLVSPSRGLLLFEPALVALLACAALRRRTLAVPRLAALGALGLGLHTLVVATWQTWWGGHGYGPRLFTETVFYQALVALAVAASLAADAQSSRGWRRALVALALVGVVVHGAGALSQQSNRWNLLPVDVDAQPERLWEWSDSQALAWAHREPRRRATIGASQVQPP